jgi:heme exporter protein C
MLWGKPMWGAYWVWDPRLTAELVLLFLYFGYMGLRAGIEDPVKADKASAVLAVVGVINVPIIKFSVEWWNSLHQVATVMQMGKPKMDFDMLWPLLLMFLAFASYFITVLLIRLRAELLRRERNASWIREVLA